MKTKIGEPKLIYRSKTIPYTKIPANTSLQKWQVDSKIRVEVEGTQNSQNNLGKEEQSWKSNNSWFQNLLQSYTNQDSVVLGSSLVVQWLGLSAFTAVGLGSTPGQGTKIRQAAQHSQKKKKKTVCFWENICIW